MTALRWISTEAIAKLAGITPRAARKAVRPETPSGLATIWRGVHLQIRTVRGTEGGGRAGFRYEVLASSLPLDLQERLKASERAASEPLRLVDGRGAERDWWSAILAPALAHEKRAPASAALRSQPF